MQEKEIIQDAINELKALEEMFEQGRVRSYNTRKILEGFYPPAPSGGKISKSKILKLVDERYDKIYKESQK